MDETSAPASILMHAAPKVSSGKSCDSRSSPCLWIPRPAYAAIAFVLILTIGWGALNVIGYPSQSGEDAELAELDGFDEASPYLGVPEHQTKQTWDGSSSRDVTSRPFVGRTNPGSVPPVPGSIELPTLSPTPGLQASRLERVRLAMNANQQTTSGAWLIGTIEADDASDRLARPPRVSQTAANEPLFR